MRLFKKISVIFAVVIIFCSLPIFQTSAAFTPPFDISSNAVYLVNLETGSVLYEKNSNEKVPAGILTQIMTEITAMSNISDLDNTKIMAPASIFNELYGKGGYTADIRPYETLSAKDYLYGLFLQNSFESALTLASHVGNSSISDFVTKMNDSAKDIGAADTNFTNPTGMDDDNQYTTAYDMYLIAKYAMDNIPNFKEMSNALSYTLPKTDKAEARVLSANNLMISRSSGGSYYYQYAEGIKTGTTDQSGRCLITTATKNGYTYMLVILGAPIKDSSGKTLSQNVAFTEAKELFNWAFDDFSLKTVVKADETVADVKVKLSFSTDHVLLSPEKDFLVLLPSQADESSVQKTLNVPDTLKAPIKKGDVVGTMSFSVADEKVGEVNLIATQDIAQNQLMYLLDFIVTIFDSIWMKVILAAIVILVAVYVVIVIVSNKRRNKYKVIRHRRL